MATWHDAKLEEHITVLFQAKSVIHALQEERRGAQALRRVGSSLQSYVSLEPNNFSNPAAQLLQTYSAEELEAFSVVSRAHLHARLPADAEWQTSAPVKITVNETLYDFTVHVHATTDQKCVRCWRYVVADEEAEKLEKPLCQRCLGTWSSGPYIRDEKQINNPVWLQEHLPRIQAVMKALKEEGGGEGDR